MKSYSQFVIVLWLLLWALRKPGAEIVSPLLRAE
jgi:hypothetical protein